MTRKHPSKIIIAAVLLVLVVSALFLKQQSRKYQTIDYVAPLMGDAIPGERVRVRLLEPEGKSNLERGTVVLYQVNLGDEYERRPGRYISRIIGLPGETIGVRDSRILVNGVVLEEPYIDSFGYDQNLDEIIVPLDSYLLIGDLRTDLPIRFITRIEDIIGEIERK